MARLRLTTLGRTDLVGVDGNAILSVLSQPKRFALLVYLAVEGSRGLIRRDTLAALFWPEQDQSDARTNLRKSLHFLRKSLGHEVIVARGDEEVGVDPTLLDCDVVTVLGGGAADERGTFLEGFHVSGAPVEWEDWLESVRARVRALAPVGDVSGPRAPPPSGPDATTLRPQGASNAIESRPWQGFAVGASGLVVILAVGLALVVVRDREARRPVRYDQIVLGSGARSSRDVHRHYALAPDGSGVLFRDTLGGRWGAWWKSDEQLAPSPRPQLYPGVSPIFSPDGRWIAFARDGHLLKTSADGATTLLLADSVSGDFTPGLAWLRSGDILYEDVHHHLRRVSDEGGASELVAIVEDVGEVHHVSGLEDGGGVFVTGCDTSCESGAPRLSFVDFKRDTVVLVRRGVWMAWAMSDGRVVMVDGQGGVSAASFEPSTGVLGEPIPLLNGVAVSPFPEMAVGADGTLLYVPGGVEPNTTRLAWTRRDGRRESPELGWPPAGSVGFFSLSPGGGRLALTGLSADSVSHEWIWIKDLPTGAFARMTVGSGRARQPVWSPDGRTLAFITEVQRRDGAPNAFVSSLPADGSSREPRVLLRSDQPILEVALTPDGRTAVVLTGDAHTGRTHIAYASLDGNGRLHSLPDSEADAWGIDLSPDGRWLAYVSEVGGRPEVFVRPFPGAGPKAQVSENGGVEPRWAHSGKEIFYRDLGPGGSNRPPLSMVSASVGTEPTLRIGSRKILFGDNYPRGPKVRSYDVAEDDQRFLLIKPYVMYVTQGPVVYSRGWYWSDEIQARLRR